MSDVVEVVVGVIGKPHGIRGEVTINLRTDEPDRRFAQHQQLRGEHGGTFSVAHHRWHQGRLLATFAELTDRNTAEAARGTVLMADVPAAEVPVGDGEYYDRQLVGLAAVDEAGTALGAVVAVLHLPAQDVLEIDTGAGKRLVPFVAALVPTVDLTGGRVVLADVPGLLTDEVEERA
ncbi:MAG: ribosome maturation factor RimM [Propionibacteriaceae bacterium]